MPAPPSSSTPPETLFEVSVQFVMVGDRGNYLLGAETPLYPSGLLGPVRIPASN
jgi:hypothetical protein